MADTPEEKPRSKFDKRPTSISGFKAPSTLKDGKKTRTKTAQMLIREDVSVRPPASMQTLDPVVKREVKREEGFIKPEGVDEPIRTARRAPTEGRKRERDQDTTGADRTGRPRVQVGRPAVEGQQNRCQHLVERVAEGVDDRFVLVDAGQLCRRRVR